MWSVLSIDDFKPNLILRSQEITKTVHTVAISILRGHKSDLTEPHGNTLDVPIHVQNSSEHWKRAMAPILITWKYV